MFIRKGKVRTKAEDLFNQAIHAFDANNLDSAYRLFQESRDQFTKLKEEGKEEAEFCSAYVLMLEGFFHREKALEKQESQANDHRSIYTEFIESMKSFGQAFVSFSSLGQAVLAQKVRSEQARSQVEFAKAKGIEGDFNESARLFESAGAVFQMAGYEKEAASARARSYVQRAAQVQDNFEKAKFLKQAVEQFKKAQEITPRIEAHALFYEGMAMTEVNVRQAIQLLARAADKYEQAGATDRVRRVREILEDLVQQVRDRPSDYGVSHRY